MNTLKKIQTRIYRAEQLYSEFSKEMLEDTRITLLLAEYQQAIYHTKSYFQNTEVVEACSRCAQTNEGSCCFEGMEDNYDHILLLINLLMGVKLPHEREVNDHCFFVGSKGCKLLARYYFCVNYFCPELENTMGEQKMNQLSTVIGNEIFAGWELEQALRNWLRSKNH